MAGGITTGEMYKAVWRILGAVKPFDKDGESVKKIVWFWGRVHICPGGEADGGADDVGAVERAGAFGDGGAGAAQGAGLDGVRPAGAVGAALGAAPAPGERALARAGVGRVILPQDFPWKDKLQVLRPVDVFPFWRGAADVLALGALDAENIPRNRGTAALSAPRLCPELEGAAQRLCPQVRGLLIDAPGGLDFARYLQARYGLPVTPPSAGADVTVAFGEGGGRWGRSVELYPGGAWGGLSLDAPGLELPENCAGQVLALLWEQGEVRREDLAVTAAGI